MDNRNDRHVGTTCPRCELVDPWLNRAARVIADATWPGLNNNGHRVHRRDLWKAADAIGRAMAFHPEAAANGIWMVPTDRGTARPPAELPPSLSHDLQELVNRRLLLEVEPLRFLPIIPFHQSWGWGSE